MNALKKKLLKTFKKKTAKIETNKKNLNLRLNRKLWVFFRLKYHFSFLIWKRFYFENLKISFENNIIVVKSSHEKQKNYPKNEIQ